MAQSPTGSTAVMTPTTEFQLSSSTLTTAAAAAATNITDKADVLGDPGPQTNTTTGRYLFERPAGALAEIQFYGVGADNTTLNWRVWRWHRQTEGTVVQWSPVCMGVGTATLSTKTGVAGGTITDSHRYADTITVTADYGLSPLGSRTPGPSAANGAISLVVDPLGSDRIEVELWVGTATSGGCRMRGVAS